MDECPINIFLDKTWGKDWQKIYPWTNEKEKLFMIFLLTEEVKFFFQERHMFVLTILEIRMGAGPCWKGIKKKKSVHKSGH